MNSINFQYKIIGNGNSTLIIETGIGNSFYDWNPFIEGIKDYFTVIIKNFSSNMIEHSI